MILRTKLVGRVYKSWKLNYAGSSEGGRTGGSVVYVDNNRGPESHNGGIAAH